MGQLFSTSVLGRTGGLQSIMLSAAEAVVQQNGYIIVIITVIYFVIYKESNFYI